jgi:hypothetical protein
MKTSELTGVAFDWAVAKCEGLLAFGYKDDMGLLLITLSTGEAEYFKPTLDWAQGGPIIEREGISVCPDEIAPWCAFFDNGTAEYVFYTGETPLIAAMRCYVASKLGDEVEIPEELK